jgi:hypothetical protein
MAARAKNRKSLSAGGSDQYYNLFWETYVFVTKTLLVIFSPTIFEKK